MKMHHFKVCGALKLLPWAESTKAKEATDIGHEGQQVLIGCYSFSHGDFQVPQC